MKAKGIIRGVVIALIFVAMIAVFVNGLRVHPTNTDDVPDMYFEDPTIIF